MIDTLTLAEIPAEDEALRGEIRAFVAEAMAGVPPHVRARSWAGFDARVQPGARRCAAGSA